MANHLPGVVARVADVAVALEQRLDRGVKGALTVHAGGERRLGERNVARLVGRRRVAVADNIRIDAIWGGPREISGATGQTKRTRKQVRKDDAADAAVTGIECVPFAADGSCTDRCVGAPH